MKFWIWQHQKITLLWILCQKQPQPQNFSVNAILKELRTSLGVVRFFFLTYGGFFIERDWYQANWLDSLREKWPNMKLWIINWSIINKYLGQLFHFDYATYLLMRCKFIVIHKYKSSLTKNCLFLPFYRVKVSCLYIHSSLSFMRVT